MELSGKLKKALPVRMILIFVSMLVSNFIATTLHAAPNLIFNGDFEAGNMGFSSDYSVPSGQIVNQGTYKVLLDPRDPSGGHPDASSFGDHTTGAGLMMAVNGATNTTRAVWSQTVPVTPNTSYAFSAWVASWYPDSPAELQFIINGNTIGTFTASQTTGLWQQFSASWNSAANSSTTIRIVDLNPEAQGNDFVLDDITFMSNSDSDSDGVSDEDDICPGFDDNIDSDSDTVPDGCDICVGDDAAGDTDDDGACDDSDPCPTSALELCLFPNQGTCISDRITEFCAGLMGQDRAACNHEQQEVCKDFF